MKITNNRVGGTSPGIDASKTGKAGKADAAVSGLAGREAVKNSAKVDVSDRAQMMQKAKEIASRPDSIDEAKVARLQKLIDEGSYKVDADAIADRLVDEHLSIPD